MRNILIGIAVVLGLILFIRLAIAEQRAFNQYVIDNNCRKAGYIEGYSTTSMAVQPNGSVIPITTTVPRRTRWLCDNEVEIIR